MRRFEELRTELRAHGVEVVALSKDTVADAAKHRIRDGLSMTLLADPELDVIRRYGVEHHKAVEYSKGRFTLFGIFPLALVPQVKAMAIPTTLLVDESGVIRWIDQSDDYRVRSSAERVFEAIEAAWPPGTNA